MTPEKFKSAPGFDKDQWPDFANRNWAAEIDTYYVNVKVAKRPVSEKSKPKEQVAEPLVYRASKIEGLAVKNDAHENLGKVEDLMVDLRHSHVRYAALEFGGFLGLGDKLFAIPWQAFLVRTDEKGKAHLELNVSQERLKSGAGLRQEELAGRRRSPMELRNRSALSGRCPQYDSVEGEAREEIDLVNLS